MQLWEISKNLQPLTRRVVRNILGSTGHKTQKFPGHKRIVTQVVEINEGRVAKKLSKELSKTGSCILGALSRFDEFLLNPLIRSILETSRNLPGTNQVTKEEDSQSDPHRESSVSQKQTMRTSGPIDGCDMVTVVEEKITYCSPATPSGKHRKTCAGSQLQFRSENNPATIKVDQNLLAVNTNSANFNNNIHQISKFPQSITTTTPMFDGKFEKFELFKNLLQTTLKIHNHLTEDDRIIYFHSFMRVDALQTFKSNKSPIRIKLEKILAAFFRKYVKHRSRATARHKFQQLVFNPAS